MRTVTRALCVVALVVATVTVASAASSSCGISHCTSCLSNYCLWCDDGYYASGGACSACSANCRSCAIAGRCTSCNDGYKLSYIENGDSGVEVAKYGTCETKGTSATCTDAHCTSCIGGTCLYCASGYYVKDGACASCEAAHCAHCEVAGRCVACDAGYRIKYVNSTDNGVTISKWGTCANGATFSNAYALLAGAAAIALTIVMA